MPVVWSQAAEGDAVPVLEPLVPELLAVPVVCEFVFGPVSAAQVCLVLFVLLPPVAVGCCSTFVWLVFALAAIGNEVAEVLPTVPLPVAVGVEFAAALPPVVELWVALDAVAVEFPDCALEPLALEPAVAVGLPDPDVLLLVAASTANTGAVAASSKLPAIAPVSVEVRTPFKNSLKGLIPCIQASSSCICLPPGCSSLPPGHLGLVQ